MDLFCERRRHCEMWPHKYKGSNPVIYPSSDHIWVFFALPVHSAQDLLPSWYVPHMWHTNAECCRHRFSGPWPHTCLFFSQCWLPSSWAHWHTDVWCAHREDVCQDWDMPQVMLRDSPGWGLRALHSSTVLPSLLRSTCMLPELQQKGKQRLSRCLGTWSCFQSWSQSFVKFLCLVVWNALL